MDRRSFLKTTGAAAGVAAVPAATTAPALAAPAVTMGLRQLSLVSELPESWPVIGEIAGNLARRVAAMSDGRVALSVRHVAGSAAEADSAMRLGSPVMLAPRHVAFEMFAGMPHGLTGDPIGGWLAAGGGQALWDDLALGHGRKVLFAGRTGGIAGFWLDAALPERPRFSAHGAVGRALGVLGLGSVTAPEATATDITSIDGMEGVSPLVDLASGVMSRLPVYAATELPGAERVFALEMDDALWRGLGTSGQAMLEAAMAAEAALVAPALVAHTPLALDLIRSRQPAGGRHPLSRLAARRSSPAAIRDEVLDWYAGQGAEARRIAESYRSFCRLVGPSATS